MIDHILLTNKSSPFLPHLILLQLSGDKDTQWNTIVILLINNCDSVSFFTIKPNIILTVSTSPHNWRCCVECWAYLFLLILQAWMRCASRICHIPFDLVNVFQQHTQWWRWCSSSQHPTTLFSFATITLFPTMKDIVVNKFSNFHHYYHCITFCLFLLLNWTHCCRVDKTIVVPDIIIMCTELQAAWVVVVVVVITIKIQMIVQKVEEQSEDADNDDDDDWSWVTSIQILFQVIHLLEKFV